MRLLPRFTALLGFVALGLAVTAPASESPEFQFQFTEKPGMYSVGLKVIEQYDASRVFALATDDANKPATPEGPRPLQTLVWYPAGKSTCKSTTLADYAALIQNETSFGNHPS